MALESGLMEELGAGIGNLALIGFLCNLGVQYILGSFLFILVTSGLNLFFRHDVLSQTILSTGLITFTYVDVMKWALSRTSSSIKFSHSAFGT